MSWEDSLEPLTWDAAYWLVESREPGLPLENLGELCLELEHKISSIGIMLLLSQGSSDDFYHNLLRAAGLWETFLSRCLGEPGGTDDHNYCAGIFAPFLDALAARDLALAARLGGLAPAIFRKGHEHESDFCFARASYELLVGALPAQAISALIDRCEETGNALSVARAALLRALLGRDQAEFDAAFSELLLARADEIRADVDRGQVASETVLAHRALFIEGIAFLNLAEHLGLVTQADYPSCPSLARVPMVKPFTG